MVNKLVKIGESRIPGFSQLLSKRPDQFSREFWPKYYSKAKGSYIWDLNNKKYLDFSFSGIGANIFGYADKDIDDAVISSIKKGSSSSVNCYEEAILAEELCKIHPWADMVRYSKAGGEATSIAIRIARAYSNKDIVLFCGYHGWNDWYIAANLSSKSNLDDHLIANLTTKGLPKQLEGTAYSFKYNDTQSFLDLFKQHKSNLAAVIMEPLRSQRPNQEFLETIRTETARENIPLIFDEISSGFRLCLGGAHLKFGINPDIAVFAKALGNGYPISAVVGKKEIMNAAQHSFISSTNWTERLGVSAAIAVIDKYRKTETNLKLHSFGKEVQNFWKEMNEKYNLDLVVSGMYQLSYMRFNQDHLIKKTFFIEKMLERGILSTDRYYPNYSQTTAQLNSYKSAAEDVFKMLTRFNSIEEIKSNLKGSIVSSGLQVYA